MDEIKTSGNSWITCQHGIIGKDEDTRNRIRGNRSLQGFPSPECLIVISEIDKKEQVTNPLNIFGTAVGTVMTRWTIKLRCWYEFGASYQWWRLGKYGHVDLLITDLVYFKEMKAFNTSKYVTS